MDKLYAATLTDRERQLLKDIKYTGSMRAENPSEVSLFKTLTEMGILNQSGEHFSLSPRGLACAS